MSQCHPASTTSPIPVNVFVCHVLADGMVELLVLFKRSLSQLLVTLPQVPVEGADKLHTPDSAQQLGGRNVDGLAPRLETDDQVSTDDLDVFGRGVRVDLAHLLHQCGTEWCLPRLNLFKKDDRLVGGPG